MGINPDHPGRPKADPKPSPPIRRVMRVSTGTTLDWIPRADGGLDLGQGDVVRIALTAEEFGWFLDDLNEIRPPKPPGPVYREGVRDMDGR